MVGRPKQSRPQSLLGGAPHSQHPSIAWRRRSCGGPRPAPERLPAARLGPGVGLGPLSGFSGCWVRVPGVGAAGAPWGVAISPCGGAQPGQRGRGGSRHLSPSGGRGADQGAACGRGVSRPLGQRLPDRKHQGLPAPKGGVPGGGSALSAPSSWPRPNTPTRRPPGPGLMRSWLREPLAPPPPGSDRRAGLRG